MKSMIEILKLTEAIGYNDEPIKLGHTYFSVGNDIWQYKIINIIDKHNIEFTIQEIYYDTEQQYSEVFDDTIRRSPSKYLTSYNLYANQFAYFF